MKRILLVAAFTCTLFGKTDLTDDRETVVRVETLTADELQLHRNAVDELNVAQDKLANVDATIREAHRVYGAHSFLYNPCNLVSEAEVAGQYLIVRTKTRCMGGWDNLNNGSYYN